MTASVYDDALIAAAKAAHGAGRLDAPTASVTCDNPLCGDRITLDLRAADGRVTAVGHKTRGCLLTQAAASVVGALAPLASTASLREAARELRELLSDDVEPSRAELAVFRAVRPVRSRHACVLLPFDALLGALNRAEHGDERGGADDQAG